MDQKEEEEKSNTTTKIKCQQATEETFVALRETCSNKILRVITKTNGERKEQMIDVFDYCGFETPNDYIDLERDLNDSLKSTCPETTKSVAWPRHMFLRENPNGGACMCSKSSETLQTLVNRHTSPSRSRRYAIVNVNEFRPLFEGCSTNFWNDNLPLIVLRLFFGTQEELMNNIINKTSFPRDMIHFQNVLGYLFQEENKHFEINYVLLFLSIDEKSYSVSFPNVRRRLGESTYESAVRAFTRTSHGNTRQPNVHLRRPFSMSTVSHLMPGSVTVDAVQYFLFKL